MPATARSEDPKNRKIKERRVSGLPLKDYLRVRLEEADMKNVEFAQALGYQQGNVIAMMKSGDMRLPINKVKLAAKALGIDQLFLLEKVVSETDGMLWDSLKDVIGDRAFSANEVKLNDLVRQELEGYDIDLTNRPEFVSAVQSTIREIVQREKEMTQATLRRLDGARKKS